MNDTTFDIDSLDITEVGVPELLDVLKTQGKDAFIKVFSDWYLGEDQEVYDLVIKLVRSQG